MLAYAANRPRIAQRNSSPNAMLVVIGVHVAAIAVVMSAKMDIPIIPHDPPPTVFWVPKPTDPPPQPTHQPTQPRDSWIDRAKPEVATPPTVPHAIDTSGTNPPNLGSMPGTATVVFPDIRPPITTPVKSGPQLLTPASELKPPYPASKLLNEEEATLALRLTIDQNGRVIAVDPVGRADPVFLAAARRHLIARWRYKPALEGGQPVTSSTVITLRFQLDG